jgi:hypothetical protein
MEKKIVDPERKKLNQLHKAILKYVTSVMNLRNETVAAMDMLDEAKLEKPYKLHNNVVQILTGILNTMCVEVHKNGGKELDLKKLDGETNMWVANAIDTHGKYLTACDDLYDWTKSDLLRLPVMGDIVSERIRAKLSNLEYAFNVDTFCGLIRMNFSKLLILLGTKLANVTLNKKKLYTITLNDLYGVLADIDMYCGHTIRKFWSTFPLYIEKSEHSASAKPKKTKEEREKERVLNLMEFLKVTPATPLISNN